MTPQRWYDRLKDIALMRRPINHHSFARGMILGLAGISAVAALSLGLQSADPDYGRAKAKPAETVYSQSEADDLCNRAKVCVSADFSRRGLKDIVISEPNGARFLERSGDYYLDQGLVCLVRAVTDISAYDHGSDGHPDLILKSGAKTFYCPFEPKTGTFKYLGRLHADSFW
jgi:hypothetical protein